MEKPVIIINKYGVHAFKNFNEFGNFVRMFPNLKLAELH